MFCSKKSVASVIVLSALASSAMAGIDFNADITAHKQVKCGIEVDSSNTTPIEMRYRLGQDSNPGKMEVFKGSTKFSVIATGGEQCAFTKLVASGQATSGAIVSPSGMLLIETDKPGASLPVAFTYSELKATKGGQPSGDVKVRSPDGKDGALAVMEPKDTSLGRLFKLGNQAIIPGHYDSSLFLAGSRSGHDAITVHREVPFNLSKPADRLDVTINAMAAEGPYNSDAKRDDTVVTADTAYSAKTTITLSLV